MTFRPLDLAAAFLSGGLLTLMVLLNGRLSLSGGPLFASWAAHGTGSLAAVILVLLFRDRGRKATTGQMGPAPLWAYLGGVSGAITVILSSVTVNTALALSGTLALGLAGQVGFSLLADRFGLFGCPKRRPDLRDMAAVGCICAGSLILILGGSS
jgi:transporter family-2 protein